MRGHDTGKVQLILTTKGLPHASEARLRICHVARRSQQAGSALAAGLAAGDTPISMSKCKHLENKG